MKKLLVIAYVFPPAGTVGVYRTLKFVKYLPEFGWEPIVLTASNGKYPTFDPSLLKLVPADTRVHRCRSFERLNEGFNRPPKPRLSKTIGARVQTRLYLTWHWFALPDTRVGWVPSAWHAARRLIRTHGVGHVYISGSPFSSFLVGGLLKGSADVKVAVDYRDPWTQNLDYTRRTALHRWIDRRLERWVVDRSDLVISNTRHNDARMAAEFGPGKRREKFIAIHNGFDGDEFSSPKQARNDKFTITYAGAFYYSVGSKPTGGAGVDVMKTYSPLYFFTALEQLIARRPEVRDTVRVRFMGVLGHGYDPVIRERGLEGVIERLGYVDYDKHLRVLKDSDVLLLVLSRGETSRGWVPSKFYQYLGTGNPILALAPEGEVREIVAETQAGVCVAPDDATGASRALEEMYDAWASGTLVARRSEAATRYERRELTARLAAALERM